MNEEKFQELYKNTKKEEIIKELCYKCKANNELVHEIERLNNIINELEKDIKNLYTYGIKNNAEQRDYLLNRLQELKGDDKE